MSIDLGRELGKAREQLQLGNKTEAARLSRRLAKRFKTSAEPCVLLAEAEQAQGQIEKSCKAMRDACRRSPRSAQLFAAYEDLCMAAEQFDNALGGYRSALALEPGALPYKSRLAAALQAVGSIADATVLHREVLEASPNDAQAHFNVGTALKRAHDFAGALAAFRNAVDRAPHDGRLRFALATLLIETEAFALAVEHLDWLIEREIDLPAALHACAYANKKLGRGAASVVAAERLVLCTEGSHGAALALSAAHIGAQQFGPALTIIERELERQPDSRQLWSDQAIALSALGRKGDARQLFDTENLLQVIDITPPAEFDDIHRFNEALQAHVEHHPSLDFSGISMSCHEGATSSELFVAPLGPVGHLMEAIRGAAEQYMDNIREASEHPWSSGCPGVGDLELSGWATQLRSLGYQHGHIHPTAWLSGVYYVALPPEVGADSQAGWIEFGRAPYFYGEGDQGCIHPVQPVPGRLVLFPSYFYHRTIPFESAHERLTIAFDFR